MAMRNWSTERMSKWRRERDLVLAEKAAKDARQARVRGLIRAYEATGRDWRSPERVALEAALKAHGEAVTCGEWAWSYSRAESSLCRSRVLLRPHAAAPAPPRLPRMYRSGLTDARPDLVEMSPESVEG